MTRDGRATVFVYGTLRAGGVRAIPTLFPAARLVGAGAVAGRLRDFGAYPGLVLDPAGPAIAGEVYEVPDSALRAMDEIERYDPADEAGSYYLRRRVPVTLAAGGTVQAWTYECGSRLRELGSPIMATDWIAHARAKGELPPEAWPDGAAMDRQAPPARAARPPAGPDAASAQ
jgi:gamma-glutamylcyclotransferase (GGCT)/AIG2-like uncharacterized protein YtfP